MKSVKYMVMALAVLIATMFPKTALAAKSTTNIILDKDYAVCSISVVVEKAGTYSGYVADEDGNKYSLIVADETHLSCVVRDLAAGSYKVVVKSKDDYVPAVTVTVRNGNESSAYDPNQTIAVGIDIAKMQTYFDDNDLVISWEESAVDNVTVKVTNLNTNETIANEQVVGKDFRCTIPDGTKELFISVVPTESANIQGAEKSFTKTFVNNPDVVVSFPESIYCNKDYVTASVTFGKPYSFFVNCNDTMVIETEKKDAGTYDINIPLIDEGTDYITLYVVDEMGNRRSYSNTIFRDTQIPRLTFSSEYNGAVSNEATYTITGRVIDYDTLKINDTDVSVATDGQFSFECALHEGENDIHVVASDVAGNTAEEYFTISYQVKNTPKFDMTILFVPVVIGVLIFVFKSKNKGVKKEDNKEMNEEKITLANDIETEDDELDEDVNLSEDVDEAVSKEKKREKQRTISNEHFKNVMFIILTCSLIWLCFNYVLELAYIPSESMRPTIEIGDIVVSSRVGNKANIKRGSIVTFFKEGIGMCKRVIGLPNDVITFESGKVYVNGEMLDESAYLSDSVKTSALATYTVPEGCYFLLGDNRESSYDARYWAEPYVAFEDIESVELFILPTHIIKGETDAVTE